MGNVVSHLAHNLVRLANNLDYSLGILGYLVGILDCLVEMLGYWLGIPGCLVELPELGCYSQESSDLEEDKGSCRWEVDVVEDYSKSVIVGEEEVLFAGVKVNWRCQDKDYGCPL